METESVNVGKIRIRQPIRKVPAESEPYGESISRNDKTVWAAFDGECVVGGGCNRRGGTP
jgi:hypothetical protein